MCGNLDILSSFFSFERRSGATVISKLCHHYSPVCFVYVAMKITLRCKVNTWKQHRHSKSSSSFLNRYFLEGSKCFLVDLWDGVGRECTAEQRAELQACLYRALVCAQVKSPAELKRLCPQVWLSTVELHKHMGRIWMWNYTLNQNKTYWPLKDLRNKHLPFEFTDSNPPRGQECAY